MALQRYLLFLLASVLTILSGCSIPVRDHDNSGHGDLATSLYESDLASQATLNHVQILTRGDETFQSLHYRISQAKQSVLFAAYIFQPDATGLRMCELLKRKAREGVDVRLLLDAWGSIFFTREMKKDLMEAGVRVTYFRPFEVFRPYRHLLRNHRRLIIIDGEYALTGGFAVQDVWADLYEFQVQDLQVWVQGPLVLGLKELFILDWCRANGGEDSICSARNENLTMERIPPPVEALNPPLPGGEQEDCNPIRQGCTGLTSAMNTSDIDNPSANYNFYLRAIAKSQERIWMVTPYFIPDARFLRSLKSASQRGADVRLIMASSESIQEFPVNYVRNPYIEELLAMGARVYVFESGFLHSKASLFDRNVSIIGTSNLDRRSFNYNHELDLISFDSRTNHALARVFQRYMESSRELSLEELKNRSLRVRILELFWWPLIPQL